jgi:segregation and condensation protein A
MLSVTRQYLAYVEQIRNRNLELAAEYLLMAAMLIEIKSRMLLPSKKAAPGEEAEDPRAELVRRLLEYEQMKLAAARLNALPVAGRDFMTAQIASDAVIQTRLPDVNPADLQAAWQGILQRARLVQHHTISREQLSVREHMTLVLRRLQGQRFMAFEALFDDSHSVAVVVVMFVAILELAKETMVQITQAESFAPIYLRLAYTPDTVLAAD